MAETGWSGLHDGELGKPRKALRHFPYRSPLVSQVWIGELLRADMNSTADQAIYVHKPSKYYRVQSIRISNATISLTNAKGSVYVRPNKAGPLVNATTTAFSGLTAPATWLETAGFIISITVQNQFITDAEILYLSLTTAQGSAAYCDVQVIAEPYWDEIFHLDDRLVLRG